MVRPQLVIIDGAATKSIDMVQIQHVFFGQHLQKLYKDLGRGLGVVNGPVMAFQIHAHGFTNHIQFILGQMGQ